MHFNKYSYWRRCSEKYLHFLNTLCQIEAEYGNVIESIMQTTQFSTKHSLHKLIKSGWNERWNAKIGTAGKSNYYFNFKTLWTVCVRDEFFFSLWLLHSNWMSFANYFLDFEDFIAIIIKEMFIYRQRGCFFFWSITVAMCTPYEHKTCKGMTTTVIKYKRNIAMVRFSLSEQHALRRSGQTKTKKKPLKRF